MKRIFRVLLPLSACVAALFFGCAPGSAARGGIDPTVRADVLKTAQTLVAAYPDAAMHLEEDEEGLFIRVGGERILFGPWGTCPTASPDDPKDAPLCAMFAQAYPVGAAGRSPARGFDPGRVRNEALLKALYGNDAREVEKHLAPVDFFGEKLLFSTRHGADAALRRVVKKLETVMRKHPSARAYILPTGGTYAWRKIKSSPRLSAHSFAVCIDLNINKGLYWLWRPSPESVEQTKREYPQAIVDAFESEGFIWGGKWYSFDFMHFEYRPELLLQARATEKSG